MPHIISETTSETGKPANLITESYNSDAQFAFIKITTISFNTDNRVATSSLLTIKSPPRFNIDLKRINEDSSGNTPFFETDTDIDDHHDKLLPPGTKIWEISLDDPIFRPLNTVAFNSALKQTQLDKKVRTKKTNAEEIIKGGGGKESCKSSANITNAIASASLPKNDNNSSANSYLSHSVNSDGPKIQSATNSVAVLEHLFGFIENLFRRQAAIKDIKQAQTVLLKNSTNELAMTNAQHKLKKAKIDKTIGTLAASRYGAQLTLVSGLGVPRLGLDAAHTASGASKVLGATSGLAMACIAPVAAGLTLYGAKEDRKSAIKAGKIKAQARELQHSAKTEEYKIIARMIKRKQSVWQRWTSFIANIISAGGYLTLGAAGAMTFATTVGAAGIAAIPLVGWALAGTGALIFLSLAIYRYVKYRQHCTEKTLLIKNLEQAKTKKEIQAAHSKLLACSAKYAVHYLVYRLKEETQNLSADDWLQKSDAFKFLSQFISKEDMVKLVNNLKAEDTDAAKFVARKLNLPIKIKYRSTTTKHEISETEGEESNESLQPKQRRETREDLPSYSYA